MNGKSKFWPVFHNNPLLTQRVAAVFGLLFALSLQGFEARAELLFRGVEQVDGQQRWSGVKKYSNPADTAYAQSAAGGTQEVHVYLSGEVTRADVDSATVLEQLLKSGKQSIAGNTVWLASNGGDIDAGMELGRRLRRLGLFTLIGKNDQCLSACVFAFMGGERRSVSGRIGIHRPYFPFTDGGPDRQARFRYLEKMLKAFVAELDFPDSLYEAVMLVPPESMQIVTAADLKRFYLEGISPLTEDMVDAAAARRLHLSMYDYLKHKADAPACAFFEAGPGRCVGRVLEAATSIGAADDPGRTQTGGAAAAARADSIPTTARVHSRKSPDISSRDPT